MQHSRLSSAVSQATIARLSRSPRMAEIEPIAARFVYSLRLVALHERARRDPVPELAKRLGSIDLAANTLALAQVISASWPENIHLSRFCCGLLTHDEATIATLVTSAIEGDRTAFTDAISGLIRPDRMHRLWDAAVNLATAEALAINRNS